MDGFLEWLKTLDWGNVCAAIWTFVCVYGVSIFSLIIGILRLKTKNINFQEKLDLMQSKLQQQYFEQLENMKIELIQGIEKIKDNVISVNTELNQKKIEAVNKAVEEAKNSVSTIDPMKSFNIEEAMKGLV